MLGWNSASYFYPKATGDPGRDRNARTVQFACFLLASAVSVIAILNVIARELGATPLLGFAVAGLFAAIILNREGRWEWAARTAILAMLLTAMLLVFEARDGFRSLAMLLFPGMLLLSVMLLDRASYMITAGIVLVAVAALGIAERQGLTRAIPGGRSSTTSESIFFVDLSLLVFGVIGSRIARDGQLNVFDLRASIESLSKANLELTEAAEALRENEQQVLSIYNTVRDVIFHLAVEPDGRFRFVSVNAAFLRVTGLSRERVVGKTVNEIIPEPSLTMVLGMYRQAIKDRTTVLWEETSDYPTGQLTGQVSVTPLFDNTERCTHLVGSVHDITERKRAEADREKLWAQLAHAQKMESVGRLAGGLAHDFNNLMSAVALCADSAIDELSAGESAVDSVAAIRKTAEKAVALGRQLMAFSSKQVLQPEVLNLNSEIADSVNLVTRLIGEDIHVLFKPGPGLRMVRADRGQLGQILMNLAVNSRDAMPDGGLFKIKTANVEFDPADGPFEPDATPGLYVLLTVSDTGIGMDEDTRTQAFEPFFTTKEIGKGTGLGLSVVYGIVKQSGGFIRVVSEPGHGTEFRIYLPAVQEAAKPVLDCEEAPIVGGSETILLVEDEAALRHKIHEILENAGYQVLAAPDGHEAVRLSLRDARPIHLLVTDIVMPGRSGPRLAERLQTLRPYTKVLYISGYPDAGGGSVELQSLPNFVQKPFTKEVLLRRVRNVLDGVPPQGF